MAGAPGQGKTTADSMPGRRLKFQETHSVPKKFLHFVQLRLNFDNEINRTPKIILHNGKYYPRLRI